MYNSTYSHYSSASHKPMLRPTHPTGEVFSGTPTIFIAQGAKAKIDEYVRICPVEIGWLGTVQYNEEHNFFHITDVFLMDQEVSGADTILTGAGIAAFARKQIEADADKWNNEIYPNLFYWGHSHGNMGVNPSMQDDKTMEEVLNRNYPWFIRGIHNKSGEMNYSAYSYGSPFQFAMHDLTPRVYHPLDAETKDQIAAEYEEMVTHTPIITPTVRKANKRPVMVPMTQAQYEDLFPDNDDEFDFSFGDLSESSEFAADAVYGYEPEGYDSEEENQGNVLANTNGQDVELDAEEFRYS